MPILSGDIKLIASQVMDDIPTGGGAPTATVITDGVSNAIFDDISELNRAGGNVSLRKVFASVQTATTDKYMGGNVIVADPPDDPRVSVTLFTNADIFDRRSDAAGRVSAYLNAGPEWPGFLFENHIAGQRAIQICARPNAEPPTIGRTLALRWNEGQANEKEQYVRITRVTTEERTATFNTSGTPTDYQIQVITCDLSDALREDFPGTPANRAFARDVTKTIIRDTLVADASTYYGASALADPVAVGDVTAKVASIYTQLVPNSRTETAAVDVRPSAEYALTLATAPRAIAVGGAPNSQRIRIGQENRGFSYVTIFKPLPAPGSVKVTYRALGRSYSLTDDGQGNLTGSGSGTVNYLTGSVSVTLQALPDDRSAVVFYWGQNVSYTNRTTATGFRAPEYSIVLDHRGVTPGSVSISWTSGGQVRTATSTAAGELTGDATGECNHISGLLFLRPAYMPDAGGEFAIDYTWSEVREETFTGLTTDPAGSVTMTLTDEPVPGSVEVHWLAVRDTSVSSGASSVAGSSEKSSGGGTKVVGSLKIPQAIPGVIVSGGGGGGLGMSSTSVENLFYAPSTITRSYDITAKFQKESSSSASHTTMSKQDTHSAATTYHVATDDGAGHLYGTLGIVGYIAKSVTVKVAADYEETSYENNYEDAGTWESLNATDQGQANNFPQAPATSEGGGGSASAKGGNFGSKSFKEQLGNSGVVVRYKTGSATPQSATQTFTPEVVTLDLCPYTKDYIVPGSVQFTWMGTVYQDFEGVLYRNRTDTNPGIVSGFVDYVAGTAAMTDYVVNGSPTNLSINSLWTMKPQPRIANVTFNVPLSPIKPSSLILSCIDAAGSQLIATSDLTGKITGDHTRGIIDYETGLAEVQFGDWVLDSALTPEQKAEWWYSVDDVVPAGNVLAGKIWKPWPVNGASLRYAVVSYAYLPLDAAILGLDPVRLPQDGRVPIYRPGGFAVLGHTGTVGPATLSNGQTINCSRVRLSRVRLIGSDGAVIHTGYSADLDAGTVSIADVTGWAQPVTVEHRIEDMVMVSDVQINGAIAFTRQITHDYPAGSVLSSALVAGDMKARITALFDQATWSNAWADAVVGSTAPATYNDVLAPIALTNAGAITERWSIVFTNTTSFNVVGEHVGVIAVGNTSADCAPINPATGFPYFTLLATGWGSGWVAGNALRFNTVGALFPVWIVRTVQQGPETVINDSFTLLIRGDVDRP